MKAITSIIAVIVICVCAFGCGAIPVTRAYPEADFNVLNGQAAQMSADLETYIKDWLAGKVPKEIPHSLEWPGIQHGWKKNFYLVKPGEYTPANAWIVRQAEEKIDFNSLRNLYPEPHATYLVLGSGLAPFGSKAVISGDFPHCRYFSIQTTASFNPKQYSFAKGFGQGEVVLGDVDIEPDSGNVNPFRVGANRNATNRHYQATIQFAMGNQVDTNPNLRPPYHRAPGNTRVGGMMQYSGAYWVDNKLYDMNADGKWEEGAIWIRYYRIDKGLVPLAGVPLPNITYQLPDGRQYFINCDYTGFLDWGINQRYQAIASAPVDATSDQLSVGFKKEFGIFLIIAEGVGKANSIDMGTIRNLDLCATGRGETMPAPGNWEASHSCSNHINYMVKDIGMGASKVVAITGKLPTYPKTRNGEATMTNGEMRYLSFSSYDSDMNSGQRRASIVYTSVCDDEITLAADRTYVICYSRANEKPANANSQNGVTWVNWGPKSWQAFTIRWLSVSPDWIFAKTPSEVNCTWNKTSLSGMNFDKNILYTNGRTGFLKEYHPMFHHMSKSTFEGLGSTVTAAKVEAANDCGSSLGNGDAGTGILVLLPIIILGIFNGFWLLFRKNK